MSRNGSEAELRQTVISLQSQLNTLSADQAKKDATAFIDAAIDAGKPIKPMRDHYISRHQKDAAAVEAEVNALVSIHSGGIVRPPQPVQGGLDAEEASVAQLMGIDPAQMAKSKAELEKATL
jgi:phage I-like protein